MTLLEFVPLVIAGDRAKVSRVLERHPELAITQMATGAARGSASSFFFPDIAHYLYAGDSALHMAAAAFDQPMAELLIAHGATCRVKNRRGAEPLHYAADTNHWNPAAQAATIVFLIASGAEPQAVDRDGVAPLHRAIRTRSLAAVRALLDGGASPIQPNGRGSMPMQLARQTTGRGGSGSARSRVEQAGIIALLLERGASEGTATRDPRRRSR